jgi:hypothetical protein
MANNLILVVIFIVKFAVMLSYKLIVLNTPWFHKVRDIGWYFTIIHLKLTFAGTFRDVLIKFTSLCVNIESVFALKFKVICPFDFTLINNNNINDIITVLNNFIKFHFIIY